VPGDEIVDGLFSLDDDDMLCCVTTGAGVFLLYISNYFLFCFHLNQYQALLYTKCNPIHDLSIPAATIDEGSYNGDTTRHSFIGTAVFDGFHMWMQNDSEKQILGFWESNPGLPRPHYER
jgi:hypothetical protein